MIRMRCTLLAASLLACASQVRAQTITIDNVTIVDVTNGRLDPRKAIVIDGKRIARIENASSATRAAATIDGTGMFVIPGLWDMHVHAYFSNDSSRFHTTNEVMFPLFIVNGVTGIRDLGSNLDASLAARDSVAAHQLIGPRMLVSGPMLDGPTTRYAAAIKVRLPTKRAQPCACSKSAVWICSRYKRSSPEKRISRWLTKPRALVFLSRDTCRARLLPWRRSRRSNAASST